MAIWYTDYLTGNDTTGDGSIALPYKTINKAMTIGTNGDEIRVAGSGFTSLPGTISATSNTQTTWTTSNNLTGLLLPGDIITVNDAEFGDRKFFYKVQTVTSTNITVDGAWNRPSTQNLTFSKITTQHYYTTTASVTFENVNIAGKTDFKVTGGWVNSFTEQTGWTIMNYHGATATAKSGIGFTAVTGGGTGAMYFDKFMLSHLTTGFAGSTSRWYYGTLAFVYFTNVAPYGAGASLNSAYGTSDLYLTNSPVATAFGLSTVTNGVPQLNYENVWYVNTASPTTVSTLAIKINNLYTRSIFTTGVQQYGSMPSANTFIQNMIIATQQNSGSTENIVLFPNTTTNAVGSSASIENDIQIVGDNSSYRIAISGGSNPNSSINQITLPTKSIEEFGTGINTGLVGQGSLFSGLKPNTLVLDIEGEKQVFSNGGVAYADSSEFSTGSNSMRVSKIDIANSIPTTIPIKSYWNSTNTAKTVTIRAKASAATDVQFSLLAYRLQTSSNNASLQQSLIQPETKSVTTSWADYTYTGVDSTFAEILLNSYIAIGVRIDDLTAKNVWIDSVTIS